MHSHIRSGRGLEDAPNVCKDNIFFMEYWRWGFTWVNKRFYTIGEITTCVQPQENFVHAQAIVEDVVPPYQYAFH